MYTLYVENLFKSSVNRTSGAAGFARAISAAVFIIRGFLSFCNLILIGPLNLLLYWADASVKIGGTQRGGIA